MPPTRLPIVLYDDRGVNPAAGLGPLCDLRAVFEARSGAFTTLERFEMVFGAVDAVVVPPWLEGLTDRPDPASAGLMDREVLMVNGRCLFHEVGLIDAVRNLTLSGEATRLMDGDRDGETIAYRGTLSDEAALAQVMRGGSGSDDEQGGVRVAARRVWSGQGSAGPALVTRPWHLLDRLAATLSVDLRLLDRRLEIADRPPEGVSIVYAHDTMEEHQHHHAVRIAYSAKVGPQVVLDASVGPICIDEHAQVLPFSCIEGPAYIGPHAVVASQTSIRSETVIGGYGKVGGEIKASIVDDYSNKAHYGYLGNSVVGRWCNLGAGTTVSNLKNTYGEVRMPLGSGESESQGDESGGDGGSEPTGRVFQGPILGDAVRTAIGTRLLTGSCVGTAAMVACSAYPPKRVPAMSWLTDAGVQRQDPEKLCVTLERMMGRRGRTLPAGWRERLTALAEAR